tara:strand:+ start:6159 stop:7544 length:1386 start_codon:yes stop_codon:yes gene_type:complete
MKISKIENSSFRDTSGFLFYHKNEIYRIINSSYKEQYEKLMNSNLYQKLEEKNLIITHSEVENLDFDYDYYKIIKPEKIPFISYPYEWSFSQLKNAALLTLRIQKAAMKYGMTLKDASAFNVQFVNSHPIFIDTLSFEIYEDGQIWKPYKQFCQHFLAPLALMSKKDIRLNLLSKTFIDGIPIDLAAKLLPKTTFGNFGLMAHIHAHAKSQKHYEDKDAKIKQKTFSKRSFEGLIENLKSSIEKMTWNEDNTEWGDYYSDTNYSEKSFEEKKQFISSAIDEIKPKLVWDMGANTGIFSRLASNKGINTISFDIDPLAVEKNYLSSLNNSEKNILPLILDLTNPTSSIGWKNNERMSVIERGPADMIFALALVHHLAISNNVPLKKIAEFFSQISNFLIIEFIPKSDSQVKRLLLTREDIFENYDEKNFETEFIKFFKIINSKKISDSERTIYIMEKLTNSE